MRLSDLCDKKYTRLEEIDFFFTPQLFSFLSAFHFLLRVFQVMRCEVL